MEPFPYYALTDSLETGSEAFALRQQVTLRQDAPTHTLPHALISAPKVGTAMPNGGHVLSVSPEVHVRLALDTI